MSRAHGSLLRLAPRHLSIIVALLGIGYCLRYVISKETPVGGLEGQVYLMDNHKPLDGVEITLVPHDQGENSPPVRRAISGANGRFALHNVPAGAYDISASTHAHHVDDSTIYIDEGHTTPVSLGLERSLPSFEVVVHQRVYGTAEKPHLSISGYVDSNKAAHQDMFHVSLYRTRLSSVLQHADTASALEEVGRDYDPIPRLPDALLRPEQGSAPARLLSKDSRIWSEDKEGFFYQNVNFGKLENGLYLIDLAHGKDTGCAWLLVTDTALVVKRAKSQLVAFAVDMKSGQPVEGSAVRTYRGGSVIAEGTTDARGLAQLTVPGNPDEGDNDTPVTTVAIRGNDEAVVQRAGESSEDTGQYVVHAYTDRTLYRPGQRIYFKGIVRRIVQPPVESGLRTFDVAAHPPGPRYAVPAGTPVDAEILDPKGDVVLRRSYRLNGYGSFNGSADLLDEAITGVYTLKMHIAGEEHTHDIVIASYRKPEFAVTVTPDKKRYTRGEWVTMTIQAQYYFGAPVAGAKVEYSVYSSPDWASEFPDDFDYDPSEDQSSFNHYLGDSYYGSTVTDGKATLDANGKAVVRFQATEKKDTGDSSDDSDSSQKQDDSSKSQTDDEDDNGPQNMVYTCNATVTESADREVEQTGEAHVVSGDFRLTISPEGYVATPGQPMSVTLQARDYEGQPVANQPISLEESYESWSEGDYHRHKIGVLPAVTGSDGRVVVSVIPPRPGNLLLKARSVDREQHKIVAQGSIWAAADAGGDLDTTYDDLSLLTDKRHYRPGDTARVLINTARVGQTVLVTVEGDRVYRSQTLVVSHHSTVVHVPILAQYGPNVFLAACYVRDKHFAQSDTPLRVAIPTGELKVTVRADREPGGAAEGEQNPSSSRVVAREGAASSATTAAPNSQPASLAVYHPGDKITYHVQTTDAQGRPVSCEFSLGVVDEAIYALQEEDPNALRDTFYHQRSNAVNTIYSFAAQYLGDADKAEPQIVARKKFPDTAFWEPDLHTNAQGFADVTFTLQDSLTTWRATVKAHTLDTQVGRAVDKVIVTKPFLVRIETPRTLTQRDQSQIVALVHNETGQPQTARVHLTTSLLTLSGSPVQSLTIAPGAVGTATWPVTAAGFGKADVKVTAWTLPASGPQYTDGMEITLPIRPHGREDVTTFAGELTGANPETEVVRLDPNIVPGTEHLTVRITPSIASALTGGLDYLTGYPYGCVEQTMSRLLPDLLVQRALRQRGAGEVAHAQELSKMVRDGLMRLYRFQHESGAWGWWEHDSDDAWMTAYVLYGLSVAREEGYPVNASVLARGRKAAAAMNQRTLYKNLPFLMYALALTGDFDTARAIRQELSIPGLQPEALAYIVLADRVLGDDPSAARAALDRKAIVEDQTVHWATRAANDWFDSDSRSATAMGLRALLATNPQDPRIEPILRWLMLKRTGEYWEDTRDTAWVLAAFCDYLSHQSGYSGGGSVEVRLNGRTVGSYALTESNLQEKELVLRIPSASLRTGKNDVMLTRVGGNSPIFYTVELRQTIATEDIPAQAATGLTVKREYLRISSKEAHEGDWRLEEQPTNNRLNMGDHIRVRLTLTVPRDIDYVLIEDPFPAGCEVNERGDASEVTDWSYWWSSVDVRDDRIAFFARTLTTGKHVIDYNLRAQTPGSYHTMPTLMQAMYAPEMRAESDESRVEIK